MKKKFMTAFAVLLLVTITGLSQAAQKVITQYSNAAAGISGGPGGGSPYIPPIPGIGAPIVTATGAVTATETTINLGGSIYDAAGAAWYQGSSDLAYCTSGTCNFGGGLRAFFNFKFDSLDSSPDSTSSADGFVFAIINASLNTDGSGIPNRTGGAPAICAAAHSPNYNCSMGELMGYAGPGTTADTLGIRPPKMGIEFDTYPSGNSDDICYSGSMNDSPLGNSFRNHIAQMFWGDNLAGNCTYGGTNFSKSSFDDLKHGSGNNDSFSPVNSSNPGTAAPSSGYYTNPVAKPGGYNWLEDGNTHSFRIEIDRSTKTDGSGKGLYTTRVWVDCNGTSCSTDQATHLEDVVNPYPVTDPSPQINRTFELSQADHLLMNRILFGFTEATGGATQIATVTNFKIYFPQTPPAPPCTYALSPTSQSFSSSDGTDTVTVTAGAGCTWTASVTSGSSWLSITSGSSGTGNGAVNYSVTANAGSARTGTMTIAGQTFTVGQQAWACTLTIADNSFSCKSDTGSHRVYIKVYLTDGAGGPVTDATVTYNVSGGGGSGTLTNNGGGWYGGTQNSDCGIGNKCVRTGNLSGSRTVTITATRAGCTGSPLTKTMTVP
jgi:hypothetical protein